MQKKITELLRQIESGDYKALARGITILENDMEGADDLLLSLQNTGEAKLVGITGPPGAGKSSVVNALLHYWTSVGKKA